MTEIKRAKQGEAKALIEKFLASPTPKTDNCILWPFAKNSYGYGICYINNKVTLVHIAVCKHFHGPRPPGMQVAHSHTGNRHCYNPSHLRWATQAENQKDRIFHKTTLKGASHGRAKLTYKQVIEIRKRYKAEKITQTALAYDFGVSHSTISRIIHNKLWI